MSYLPLVIKRGDDFAFAFQLLDPVTEEAMELGGFVGRFVVRNAAGEAGSPLIAVTNVESDTISGVQFFEDADGWWCQPQIMKELVASAVPDGTMAAVRLAYNIRLTDTDDFEFTALSGPLEIEPEVYL